MHQGGSACFKIPYFREMGIVNTLADKGLEQLSNQKLWDDFYKIPENSRFRPQIIKQILRNQRLARPLTKLSSVTGKLGHLGPLVKAWNEYNDIDKCDPSRWAQSLSTVGMDVGLSIAGKYYPPLGALKFGSDVLDSVTEAAFGEAVGVFGVFENAARIPTILATGDRRSAETFMATARSGSYGRVTKGLTMAGDVIAESDTVVDTLATALVYWDL